MLRFGSLFSGFGGVEFGAVAAGLEPIFGVEFDPDVAHAYRANHGGSLFNQPVESVANNDFLAEGCVEALWASPPCPRFSVANVNKGETEADIAMAVATARIVEKIRPRCFFLENVRGYVKSDSFARIVDALDGLGYAIDYGIYNSADFGVPQTRMRLILRAVLGVTRVPALNPTHSKKDQVLPPWRGWYEAVEDLLPGCPDSKLADWQMRRLPADFKTMLEEAGAVIVHANDMRSMPIREGDEPMFTVMAGSNATHAPGTSPKAVLVDNGNPNRNGRVVRESEEPCKTVMSHSDRVPMRAILMPVNGENSDGRLAEDPAPAIASNHSCAKYRSVMDGPPVRVVAMTPRCLARFQSIPDTAILPDKKTLACKVIGNAVPSLMAERVIESVIER